MSLSIETLGFGLRNQRHELWVVLAVYTWSWDFEGNGSVTERARAQPGKKLSYAASCLVGSQVFEMLPCWLKGLQGVPYCLVGLHVFEMLLRWLTGLRLKNSFLCLVEFSPFEMSSCWYDASQDFTHIFPFFCCSLSCICPHFSLFCKCRLIFWLNQFCWIFFHLSNLVFFFKIWEKIILSCAKSNGHWLAQGI